MSDPICVIVTTYERPDALAAVLRGLARQSDRRFEIVVADDGSGEPTAAVIATARAASGLTIKHVWREHRGFRAALMRNLAILEGRGPYCIFLDGDCIPRADFVATHRRLARRGRFVFGNRILLSETLTRRVLSEEIAIETWGLAALARERLAGGVNRLAPALRLPLGPLRRHGRQRWQGVRTCNLAVWRRDLDRVDGFDGEFDGWGLEDSDLAVRLLRAGVARTDGRFATGVLHLWHPFADRSALADNTAKLDAVITSTRIRAVRGLSALAESQLPEDGQNE